MARGGKALSESDIYAQLPENAEERSGRLVDIAMQNAADFLSSHSLEVKIPAEATQEMARALDEGKPQNRNIYESANTSFKQTEWVHSFNITLSSKY